ncbi:hypothetical protein R3X28_02705 [Maribacter sp. TH_r10]|uniref:hypothetical protein n=1 Tax=Maribacter sp. TH_r10 TaxID=3082086 RepID=UPI0029557996|nr:hypothetical protein [Maribacter sp. TH_r10]MDV7137765.1 hypothetical protein [Maribacter sp. TH_r10]
MPKFDVYEMAGHLMKCPDTFLAIDVSSVANMNQAIALICDAYRMVSNDFLKSTFNLPAQDHLADITENHWKSMLISCWLLRYKDFVGYPEIAPKLIDFWFKELRVASDYVKAEKWINDEERAEEMIRLALKSFELLPYNENLEEAVDRLSAVSSSGRQEVLKQTNDALERMMEIKRKMAEKKAREAANPYGRE